MEKKETLRKDCEFKKSLAVANFNEREIKKEELDEYYKPDKILENMDSVIFFESSSTNDRKVHIGELCQFLAYLNKGIENKSNIYFVLFLCGTSKYPP